MVRTRNWHPARVGDVAKRVTVGFVGSQSPHFVDHGVPLLRGQNVRPGLLDLSSLKHISSATHAKWSKSALVEGDVVIVRVGYPGVAAVIPGGMGELNAASLVIVRSDPAKLDPYFFAYLLNSPWGKAAVASRLVGSAQQVLNTNAVADLEVDLPPIVEQLQIASVLRNLDDLIENCRRRVELLEQMAQAIYREWFVHCRYPRHEQDELVESDLGLVPGSWQVKRVGDLCKRVQSGGTPSRKVAEFWDDADVPWYKTGDLTDSILIDSSEHVSQQALTSSTARLFEPETILMAIYGSPTVGRLGLVAAPSSCNQAALGLVADPEVTTVEYLWFALGGLREYLNGLAQGAAQQNVSKQKVVAAPVVCPPLAIAQQFTDTAGPSWRESHLLHRMIARLTEVRDLLLPKLVTGEIDVSELDLDAVVEGAGA